MYKKNIFILVLLILALPIIQVACGGAGGSGSSTASSTAELFPSLTDNVILPLYDDLVVAANDLSTATEDFCSQPNLSDLEILREKWNQGHQLVKQMEVIQFGPVQTLKIEDEIDFWPTRTDNIEKLFTRDISEFNNTLLDEIGVSVKGFPALAYLLFGASESSEAVLEKYLLEDTGAKRCAYLKLVAEDIHFQVSRLQNSWNIQEGAFAASFSEAGNGSSVYPSYQSAITEIVNQMNFLIEKVKDSKLGKPLGKTSGGEVQVDAIESPYSESSIDDMIQNIVGFLNFYKGDYADMNGVGLYEIVKTKDSYVADLAITYALNTIELLQSIDEPLDNALQDDQRKYWKRPLVSLDC